MQKTKSLDSTVDYETECSKCGNRGVIYRKELCHFCYFGKMYDKLDMLALNIGKINGETK
jgi:ribosomal protein L37E